MSIYPPVDTRRKRRVGAPERASHALLPPLFSLLSTLTDTHCKVATHYLLLPPPYLTGAPERASHALLPPLFSLLSTRNMHTRYSLCGFVLDGESLLLEEFFCQRQVLHIFGGQVYGIAVEVF